MYLPDRSAPVVVQNRNALEALLGLAHATGTVGIAAGEITDAEVITLNDGVTERVMEFLDNLTGAAEEVRLVTVGTMVDVTVPVSAAADYALQDAMHNGDRVWYSPTTGQYVYWDGTDSWVMYDNLGVDAPTNFWKRTNASPVGEFTHQGTHTGDPDFSLADVPATILNNLIAAINVGQIDPASASGQGTAGLWAEDITVGAGEPTLRITSALLGTAGNVTITTDSDCAVAGMIDGADGKPQIHAAANCTMIEEQTSEADLWELVFTWADNPVAAHLFGQDHPMYIMQSDTLAALTDGDPSGGALLEAHGSLVVYPVGKAGVYHKNVGAGNDGITCGVQYHD